MCVPAPLVRSLTLKRLFMSIESDSDRLELLKALGEVVTVSGRSVYGIFERAFSELQFDTAIESAEPQVTVREIDVEKIQRGAVVTRQGEHFTVVGNQPDGEGMTVLRLSDA